MQAKDALVIAVVAFFGGAVGCSAQVAVEEDIQARDTGSLNAQESNAAGPEIVTGTVVESMDAAGYTYVRVDTDGGEIWAAASRFTVEVGDRVTFPLETPMRDFHSESLDRDFPLVYFVSYVIPEGEAPQATADLPPGHPSIGAVSANTEQAATITVEIPSGGMTIADVWERRVDLSGAQVTVRGRVVKFNAGILGRNWFHIQDGSGEPAKGTNDLTVTTEGTVAVGDVVTATGIVAVDRDFGAGYRYPVILEDAAVKP